MRISPIIYGVLVILVFFGTVLGFQASGIWSTSGKVSSNSEVVQPSAADVNTIKGWMTLEQITSTYHIPLAELLKQFNLPADTPASKAIKDLESDVFSVTNLRTWLTSRTSPASALPTAPAPTPTLQPAAGLGPTPIEQVTPDRTITGKTTFQQLLDWGIQVDAIQKILGGSLPTASAVIKDYVTGKGMEFSSIKTQLQAEINNLR